MENINIELGNSINKMDNLIYQLKNYKKEPTINTDINTNIYTDINTDIYTDIYTDIDYNLETSIIKNNNQLDDDLVVKRKILDESPEYYQNEINKFLNDICQEKEKRIQLFNKILNVSMSVNIILLAYILGMQY
jgi:hypothetical protein